MLFEIQQTLFEYFGGGSVAADNVSSQKFQTLISWGEFWSTAGLSLSQDTLKQAIDQLPKTLSMVIKAKGSHVEFCLD